MQTKTKNLILISLFVIGFLALSHQAYAATVTKTLYAWARDLAGNISAFLSDSVDITISSGTTYYISPTGSDTTGNGTLSSPWKTLYKACNTVTTSGDTIHVNTGTYNETQTCNLAVGVSIEGEGNSSHIIFSIPGTDGYWDDGCIQLESIDEGTNGNQSISYLMIDGNNYTSWVASAVVRRSNVHFHHITITNFLYAGIVFRGTNNEHDEPSVYSENNQVYNSTIINSSTRQGDLHNMSSGCISYGGQKNFLIHDNYFSSVDRAPGLNGNLLNGVQGYTKGMKIYNNEMHKLIREAGEWSFHIENWHSRGGLEVYNNESYGGDVLIDCAMGELTDGYTYTYSIHDNYIDCLYDEIGSYGHSKVAISIEGDTVKGVFVYNNHFKDWHTTIGITDGGTDQVTLIEDVYIYGNLMENNGYHNDDDRSNPFTMVFSLYRNAGSTFKNIYIYNNTITCDPNGIHDAIQLEVYGGHINNLNVKNNIIVGYNNLLGFMAVRVMVDNGVTGTVNNLYVDNNLLYNNTYDNDVYFYPANTGTVTNYEFLNNIQGMPSDVPDLANPQFISSTDFHLQPTSPAIDAGINVGLPYYGSAPDLGAFETNY